MAVRKPSSKPFYVKRLVTCDHRPSRLILSAGRPVSIRMSGRIGRADGRRRWLHGRTALLVDSNVDLIACYEAVRREPEAVASALDELADGHAAGGRHHYYEVRDRRFNPLRDERRGPDGTITYSAALAAMLIYLNRTGFNGLFRLNARGRSTCRRGGTNGRGFRTASASSAPPTR